MADVTEIYICQAGQALKEGQLVISHDVATREEAQTDAAYRCRLDRKIARIVYYAVRPDGGFRTLYSHENPHAGAAGAGERLVADIRLGTARRPRKAPRPTMFGRLRALFETD